MTSTLRGMPQLPAVRFARYQRVHGVSADDARTLISDRPLADYFEAAVEAHPGQSSGRMIATWILNELLGALKAGGTTVAASPVTPGFLSELVGLVEDGTISGKIAKDVFAECYQHPGIAAGDRRTIWASADLRRGAPRAHHRPCRRR